ncbi:MAG TPA: UvrB/UvrC motif-containing protein [Phycisphaerales bacterium]|nr:UvrB/UvrC motif-containing protein [Phycisphaerales bacterium]
MKCDLCDKPACVHEVTLKNGVKKEVHLCEEHARQSGIQIPTHQPINQLLTQFVVAQGAKQQRVMAKPCPNCGLTFAQFKQTGRVGCPECYTAFEEQLTPLIERTQNGGAHHVGKSPRRAGTSIDRQVMIQRLVKEIESAVSAEQYERAATLRDKLLQLKSDVAQKDTEDTPETLENN